MGMIYRGWVALAGQGFDDAYDNNHHQHQHHHHHFIIPSS
jgi:hypothetical protein